MPYLLAFLLSLTFAWIVGTQSTFSIYSRDIYDSIEKDADRDFQSLMLRSPIIFDDDEIDDEDSPKIQSKKISTSSDRLNRLDDIKKSGKSSINDIHLDLRHKVLGLSMIEQSKKQKQAQEQWRKSQKAASWTDGREWLAFQMARTVAKRHGPAAAEQYEAWVTEQVAERKQQQQNAAKAAKTIGETARLMTVAGSVNKHMHNRMKKSFDPMPALQDTGIRAKRQDKARRPSKPDRATGGTSIRSQPGRPNGPSIRDMKIDQKQHVLERVMQHQLKKEELAMKQAERAHDITVKQLPFEKKAVQAWWNAENENEYHEAKKQHSRLKEIQQSALEKQVAWRDEKKQAEGVRENIGKINKHLRNRMPKRPGDLGDRMLENFRHVEQKKIYLDNRKESPPKEWKDLFEKTGRMHKKLNSEVEQMLASPAKKGRDSPTKGTIESKQADARQKAGVDSKNAKSETQKQAGDSQRKGAGQKKGGKQRRRGKHWRR